MNIIEAIKSDKDFRRKCWFEGYYSFVGGIEILSENQLYQLTYEDMIAEDYEVKMDWFKHFKKEIEYRGKEEVKLSKMLKVTQPTISYIENKKISLSEKLNKKIYKIFKVDLLKYEASK